MTYRERNLLLVVIAVILAALWFFLLFRPMENNIISKKAEINELNTQLSELTLEYVKKDQYLEEINEMEKYIELVNDRYPGEVAQELIIKTMIDLEEEIESLSISEYSMAKPTMIIADGETIDEETNLVYFKEMLVATQSSLDFEMTYSDMKKMLAYFQTSDYKLSINGVEIASDLQNDTVRMSFNLDYFSLVSSEEPFIPEDYFGGFEPKEEPIFMPYEEYGTDFEAGPIDDSAIYEPDDFTINLSTIYADRSSVIIYDNNDSVGASYVYADNNNLEPVEIVFEQEGAFYTYKYKTTSEQFPLSYTQGASFTPGQVIGIKVYSSSRVDVDDNTGVNATIINNTDLPVIITVEYDDVTNPRFNVFSVSGDVTVTK